MRIGMFLLLIMATVAIAFVPSTVDMVASIVGLLAGLALGILSGGRSA
jgi:hypothetical protein